MSKGFEEPGQMRHLQPLCAGEAPGLLKRKRGLYREGRARGGWHPTPLWLGVSESQWSCPGKAPGGRLRTQRGETSVLTPCLSCSGPHDVKGLAPVV